MIALWRATAPKLRVSGPELQPFVPRLTAALKANMLVSPGDKRHYLAVGTADLVESGSKLTTEDSVPLLVFDGPTPIDAKRLPSSIVALTLDHTRTAASVDHVADLLVDAIQQDQLERDIAFCDLWSSEKLFCISAGEAAPLGKSGRSLEALLAGLSSVLPEHPFWAAVAQRCQDEAISVGRVIDHVLSRQTLWFSPYTGKPISPKEALAICQMMHSHWQENDLPGHCFGAQYWNHPSIRATFSGSGGEVLFHETEEDTLSAAKASCGRVLSWAGRTSQELEEECHSDGISLSRIEDGFLRSVGLGAGLARGAMLAVDDLGIYYDPSRPSRLEVLLQEHDLTPAERQRGTDLVNLIRGARISKYNFGRSRSYDFPPGQTKILVPGQVADDAAIRKSRSATIDCANTPNVNLDLLKLARQRHPDAFLVFKPHPDVETGLRKGKVSRALALEYADDIAEDANIIDLIEAVDGLETFSSLSGFEALLRGKAVTVHGAPFYAGWGLCEDLTRLEGRGRQRSLSELVFLSLVAYARTIDPVTLLPCTPEFLISRLAEQRKDRKHLLIAAAKRHASWLGRKLGL